MRDINNEKPMGEAAELSTHIKKWYMETYPTDDLAEELFDDLMFSDVLAYINSRGTNTSIYDYFGIGDSLIRERVFEKLSEITGQPYGRIYDNWMQAEFVADDENTLNSKNLSDFSSLSNAEDLKAQIISASLERGFDVSPVAIAEILEGIAIYLKAEHEDPYYDASEDITDISNIELAGSTDYILDADGNERAASVSVNLVDQSYIYTIDGISYTVDSSLEEIKDRTVWDSWRDYMNEATAVMLLSDYIKTEWPDYEIKDLQDSFKDFSYIPVAYTTDEETQEHEIQTAVDLRNNSVIYRVDNKEVGRDSFTTLDGLVEAFLNPPEFTYFIERAEIAWDAAQECDTKKSHRETFDMDDDYVF